MSKGKRRNSIALILYKLGEGVSQDPISHASFAVPCVGSHLFLFFFFFFFLSLLPSHDPERVNPQGWCAEGVGGRSAQRASVL